MTDSTRTVGDATVAADDSDDLALERATLLIYEGTNGEARTRVLDMPEHSEVTLGRSRTCTVRVDSERVSRLHARISRRGSEIRVEDLGSRNGTRLNGTKIEGVTNVVSGDEISVGPTTLVVTITTRMARAAPIGGVSYLQERLTAEVDRGLRYRRSFALVMLRIDSESDSVAADDTVDAISARLRPMDVFAEYGPEDYAILLPEAGREAAREMVGRIVHEIHTATPRVQAQAGLALFPEHGTEAEELVSRARAALLEARRSGQVDLVAGPPEETAASGDDLIVNDPQMERVYALVRKVADHPITVLISGETGVGKEVVAQALHAESKRKQASFVRLNCASLPETLLESELFGHERGSFTGADRRKVGYFEAAHGGTIFLDEIGEISPKLQAKLLRVLEERKLTRVGGVNEIDVDVRVVCATNRDLDEEVRRGEFREDLFFRISAFTIVVPPLRDRPGEISLLAEHFIGRFAAELGRGCPTLTDDALATLRRYSWPGNVRELRNAMERAVVLQAAGVIDIEHLPERVRDAEPIRAGGGSPAAIGDGVDMKDQIAEVERATIVAALRECDGNQTRAAQKLGISRRAFIYKLEKHGLKKPPRRRARD